MRRREHWDDDDMVLAMALVFGGLWLLVILWAVVVR